MRPLDDHGWPLHQLVTRRGIYYEAVDSNARSGAKNCFGLFDLSTDKFEEVPLPSVDGCMFFENHERCHAHPFPGPDRNRMFYTEVIDGYSPVCALDVRDLVDEDEYWDRSE